ncbi:GNAT family N-acetyltransferase [Paenibacillus sp. SYP-B3998]|uniref:GNAT family N-acetyltransferase n=1 Tax=Paenibacillus sp. SYP-B3998 TaxID=2678564 RepID=A0A6G3ZY18_9BACL|nr:GNAT family N-acyltransferase [Paenibacillus sp. SYP-B3998]NEW06471.1 GNAT family N-acetyltransferase [Paenibacillus sp. SYP-B3998]
MSQTLLNTAPQHAKLSVMIATTAQEIEQAMRLRYEVFVEEEKNMRLLNEEGLEKDAYDAYCDHLIVKDLDTNQVVGTYRLLPGDRALTGIGFYSETEFDLTRYASYKSQTLELGRSCIAPEFRGGKAIQLLWEGIAAYISERNYSYLIGCASVHMNNLDDLNLIYTMLRKKEVLTDRFGVSPLPTHRIPGLAMLDIECNEKDVFRKLPPLMKGYQWLGAEIGGDPAYDELFQTVDFFIILQKDRVTRRYKRHFLNT